MESEGTAPNLQNSAVLVLSKMTQQSSRPVSLRTILILSIHAIMLLSSLPYLLLYLFIYLLWFLFRRFICLSIVYLVREFDLP